MKKVLVSWIGTQDRRAAEDQATELGPLAGALESFRKERNVEFSEVHLLHNDAKEDVADFLRWIASRTAGVVEPWWSPLDSPMDLPGIYTAARECLLALEERHGDDLELVCHCSPGTSFMAASWLLLSKSRFPAELVITSREAGLQTVDAPFDLHAELVEQTFRRDRNAIVQASAARDGAHPDFNSITFQSAIMHKLIQRAQRAAQFDVPVLIEGESGTGKALFAKAIHQHSQRNEKPFVAVNCGAIPAELVESTLFGHVQGAFGDSKQAEPGAFVRAHRGTLFLDEIGELSLAAQVKILRALETKAVTPLGASQSVHVDIRLVAATHRDLKQMVAARTFRDDLFHRLAVAVLSLPALRQRPGDLSVLLDSLLERVNAELAQAGVGDPKSLAIGVRNVAARYDWPGNVRELYNTLRRAVLWSEGAVVSAKDFEEAILPIGRTQPDAILGRDLSDGVELKALLDQVKAHYLGRAMRYTSNNKTQAAALLGLGSQQTLTNWLKQSSS